MQPAKSTWRTRFPRAVYVTLLMVGSTWGALFAVEYLETWQQAQISRWPTVEGTVVSAGVVERGPSDDPWEVLNVRFSYVVEGVTYTSGQDMNVEQQTSYPVGSPVTVHHSVSKPKIGYVDADRYVGWSWVGYLLVYPLIAVLIGFIYLWGWWVRGK